MQENTQDLVIEGPVFRQLTEQQMDITVPRIRVMARSSPTDKLLLVSALQRLGEVVAVTGDGEGSCMCVRVCVFVCLRFF